MDFQFNPYRERKDSGVSFVFSQTIEYFVKVKVWVRQIQIKPIAWKVSWGLFYALLIIIYPCLIRNIVKPRIKEIRSYTAVQDNPNPWFFP